MNSRHAVRAFVLAACVIGFAAHATTGERAALPHERAFPPGFKPPLSAATGKPIYGWGGSNSKLIASPGHTPVLFIHGNTVDATFWNGARAYFRKAGYSDDELWAPSYGFASTETFDSNDLAAPALNAFVDEVQRYLSAKYGRPVRQFDIVAHSLGVTAVRQWLTQSNRWHEIRNFVAVAGANHGVWTARPDSRGPSRLSSFELHRDSPWLAQLNAGGEVAGAMRVLTLYDGTGRYDALFPKPDQDSPALAGATNVAYNRDAKGLNGGYNHLELPREPATLAVILGFLSAAQEPLPVAVPPKLVRQKDSLSSDQADAVLRCTADGRYPDMTTPTLHSARLQPGRWLSCFAHNPRTGLSSPMARFGLADASPESPRLTLAATPEPGAYEQPLMLKLTTSDPAAMIVYSSAGTLPDSGSALYRGPVYLPAPVTLTAIAIAPDGRQSPPLRLQYNLSLEYQDAVHTLQRQLDPSQSVEFEGRNISGN